MKMTPKLSFSLLLQVPDVSNTLPKNWSSFIAPSSQNDDNKALSKETARLCLEKANDPKVSAICDSHKIEKEKRYFKYANYLNGLSGYKSSHPGSTRLRTDYAANQLAGGDEKLLSICKKMTDYDHPVCNFTKFIPLITAGGAVTGFSLGLYAAFKTRSPCLFVLGSLIGAGTTYLGAKLYESHLNAEKMLASQTYEGLKKSVEDAHEDDDAQADRSLISTITAFR